MQQRIRVITHDVVKTVEYVSEKGMFTDAGVDILSMAHSVNMRIVSDFQLMVSALSNDTDLDACFQSFFYLQFLNG